MKIIDFKMKNGINYGVNYDNLTVYGNILIFMLNMIFYLIQKMISSKNPYLNYFIIKSIL